MREEIADKDTLIERYSHQLSQLEEAGASRGVVTQVPIALPSPSPSAAAPAAAASPAAAGAVYAGADGASEAGNSGAVPRMLFDVRRLA